MSLFARKLVVVATYNEIENLPRLLEKILAVAPELEVLVVDDNSPDGTGRWCAEFCQREPRVHCLHRPGKLGLGSATIEALEFGLARNFDCIATMDADFSHDPSYLPDLFAAADPWRGSADVVIGSRYIEGGGVVGWPIYRWWMSRFINVFARWMLRLPLHDCSGGFRCYRSEVLRRLDLRTIRCQGYAYLEEMLWRLRRGGAKFAELPITFVDRRFGQTKINLREILRAGWAVARFGLLERLRQPEVAPQRSPKP